MMTDAIEIIARDCPFETGEDNFVAFAASDDPEDGYILFRRDAARIWLEVSDEIFGAYDAIEAFEITPARIVVTIRTTMAMRFGMIRSVTIRPAKDAEGWDEASAALKALLA